MSCGEYGDNIKSLVNAINNGKYDIREGYPFPDNKSDGLNNAPSESPQKDAVGGEAVDTKDKNDLKNLEEKFQENSMKMTNSKGVIPAFTNNDISKQSK